MEFKTLLTSAAIVALSAGFASAQDDATLSVDGEVIKTRADAPAFAENLDTVYSGWHFRSGETQVLQMDDFENPAFVFVDQGVDLFDKVEGSEGKACASCHEDVADFAGLRPTLPRVENGELVTMEDLVNECRTDRMGAEPWKYSGGQMTSVTALIGLQSRGMSINVAVDGDAAPFFERG
jgi:sulfur-oxidizing protein SoxA